MSELAVGTREASLQEIGNVLQYWLDWVSRERDAEGLAITPETHIMFGYENAPPHWPSVGQLAKWIEVIRMRESPPASSD